MELQVALNQNIRFLLVEVEKQVTRTGHYLRQPTPELAQKIYASDDYVDNLKTFVQTKCFSLAVEAGSSDKSHVGRLERSGARIARLAVRDGKQKALIFKEGKASKRIEERDGIRRWQELAPGIAPNIYSFQEQADRSVVLFEYLRGHTFEAPLFEPTRARLEAALRRMTQTLAEVWTSTRSPEPSRPRFMQQLLARLDDVRAVHPGMLARGGSVQGIEIAAYADLVARCLAIDAELVCPHSALIHGDFNVDNVIYDDVEDRVRFIGLHRSRRMDYCQDVSVFLSRTSATIIDPMFRRHVDWVVVSFCDWALGFAASIGDESFSMRLALGMARSYVTSTRFVLDESLVREMYLKSRYILEVVVSQLDVGVGRFRFPREVLLG